MGKGGGRLTTAFTRPALCAAQIGGQTRIVVGFLAAALTPKPRVRVKPNVRPPSTRA
jgi:hypothetical protein